MYDINKRRELKNAKVKDILEILKDLPEDAEVCFNGDNYGYIHIEKDSSLISFDDSSLDDDYSFESCPYYNDHGYCIGCMYYGDGDEDWAGDECPFDKEN